MKLSKLSKILGLTIGLAVLSQAMLVAQQNKALAQSTFFPLFLQRFVADADVGQCNGAAYGEFITPINQWSPEVRIDTDGRSGGCLQSFAIIDPQNQLSGLGLYVDFQPDGNGQCDNPGFRQIPINTTYNVTYTTPYRIDADNRSGGCRQTFYLFGRSDVVLDVSFTADGDPGQCGNTGTFTVTPYAPITFRIDTDNRSGGCRQAFRLRFI